MGLFGLHELRCGALSTLPSTREVLPCSINQWRKQDVKQYSRMVLQWGENIHTPVHIHRGCTCTGNSQEDV